jgi:hypothetical protein
MVALLALTIAGCSPPGSSQDGEVGRPTPEDPRPFEPVGPACGDGVEKERDRLPNPLAGEPGERPEADAEFVTLNPRKTFRHCAGNTIAEVTLTTVELGREAAGRSSERQLAVDETWLATAPWAAVHLILRVGDGAAPIVVDHWDQLGALTPEVRASAAVLTALGERGTEEEARTLATLAALPPAQFAYLETTPEFMPLLANSLGSEFSECLNVGVRFGEAGLGMLATLDSIGELGACAQVDGTAMAWLDEDGASTESIDARLRSLSSLRIASERIQKEAGWTPEEADLVLKRLADEHIGVGRSVRAGWFMAIEDARNHDPVLLALAPGAVAINGSALAVGARRAWRQLEAKRDSPAPGAAEAAARIATSTMALGQGPVATIADADWQTDGGVWARWLLGLDAALASLDVKDRYSLVEAYAQWPEATLRSLEKMDKWEREDQGLLLGVAARTAAASRLTEAWLVPSATSSPEQASKLFARLASRDLTADDFDVSNDLETLGAWSYRGEEAFVRTIKSVFGVDLVLGLYEALKIYAEGGTPSRELLQQVGTELIISVVLSVTGLKLAHGAGKGLLTKLFGKAIRKAADLLDNEGDTVLRRVVVKLFGATSRGLPRGFSRVLRSSGRHWDAVATRYARSNKNPVGKVLIGQSRLVGDAAMLAKEGVISGPQGAMVRAMVKRPATGSLVPGRVHSHSIRTGESPVLSFITSKALSGSGEVVLRAGRLFGRLPPRFQEKTGAWMLRRNEQALAQRAANAVHTPALVFLGVKGLEMAEPELAR